MGSVSISPYTMPRNTVFRICNRMSLNCFRPATALQEWRDTNKCYPDQGVIIDIDKLKIMVFDSV